MTDDGYQRRCNPVPPACRTRDQDMTQTEATIGGRIDASIDDFVVGSPRTSIHRVGFSDADSRHDLRSARLCRSGERCSVLSGFHAFLRLRPLRWAFSSPGPYPHQGPFRRKSGCHDHHPAYCRTT
jgi:hypothetical protein